MSAYKEQAPAIQIPDALQKATNERLRSDRLDDAGVVQSILCYGSDADMERLYDEVRKQRPELRLEDLYLLRRYHQIEIRIKDKSFAESLMRKRENPRADDDEYRLGAYREEIEPQVRDAVFALHKKGYETFESGYRGPMGQSVLFSQPVPALEQVVLSDEIRTLLQDLGVGLQITENGIVYTMKRPMEEEEMRRVWNALAEALPVIGEPKTSKDLPVADKFRKNQDERFGPRSGF